MYKTNIIMKKTLLLAGALFAFLLTSCEDNFPERTTSPDAATPPTATEFTALRTAAYNNLKQEFTADASQPSIGFTSEKGVEVTIYTSCLTKNGAPVTGEIDIEYVEIFDRGNMLVTNKTTMGIMPDGDLGLLISGGEFYINATQNGEQIDLNCGMQLQIPTSLTGGGDNDMTLWEGMITEEGNMVWDEIEQEGQQEGGVFVEGDNYYGFLNTFGWTNVDRFYNDPRPKTTIYVDVPEGFDNTNSAVYISYNEEGNALAMLDTYDPATGLFSEHYGQMPIGLECHIIFVSENDGMWTYAIQAVTITENGIITFTEAELDSISEADLIAAINALP
jgi:hypothetical protein